MAAITPVEAGLPGARSALLVQRGWTQKKDPQKEQTHSRVFLSSLSPEEGARAAEAARGHWSVENRNHHKRDVCLWQEDRHRHRKPKAALNLALTRNALLAIIPFKPGEPLSQYFDLYHRCGASALKLIRQARPVL